MMDITNTRYELVSVQITRRGSLSCAPHPRGLGRPGRLQIRDIGSGNFGVAKLMRDKPTGELVAVKFIERGEKASRPASADPWVSLDRLDAGGLPRRSPPPRVARGVTAPPDAGDHRPEPGRPRRSTRT